MNDLTSREFLEETSPYRYISLGIPRPPLPLIDLLERVHNPSVRNMDEVDKGLSSRCVCSSTGKDSLALARLYYVADDTYYSATTQSSFHAEVKQLVE